MIAALARRAEVVKLARLLDAEPDELAHLEAVEAPALRELREQVTERLFDGHLGAFRRAVHASGILPERVSATIAERAFGPLLCARLAGLVGTARAIGVAQHLSDDFLAEVAVHMDPRRASDVIAGVPLEQVRAVAERLAARGEHVVMGRFAGHLPDASLRAVFDVLADDALLQIAFTLEDGLERAVALMPDARMEAIFRCASRAGLWPEALALLEDVDEARRVRLAAIVARDPELERSALAAADAQGLGAEARELLARARAT